ncbi:MAG: HlyD family type I secretion periplasmic adaptor subunit, partial [Proteobacteria bacterium]|nr:HlyD family type I secretion periplasmic adaptor subunit [Pseudomonadota bacterium]
QSPAGPAPENWRQALTRLISSMSRLDEIVESHPIPSMRPLAWSIMFVLAVTSAWAFTAQLEEVSSATGEVVPVGQVKVIQHLEGGIIQDIYVSEGSRVAEGDALAQLGLSATTVNKEELEVRLDGLVLKLARLKAEARGEKLVFPQDVAARRPQFLRTENEAFQARSSELQSLVSSQRQAVNQRALEIKELQAKLSALSQDLGLARKNFKISKDLLDQQLTSRVDHLKLERELGAIDGEIASTKVGIDRAKSAQSEAREREREETLRFRRASNEEYSGTEQSIARTQEQLQKASEQAKRTTIRSPIQGVVKNLKYNTIGGVVQAGEAIMEIVPTGTAVVIEAKLNPIDRGYVEEGQEAVVKISTYDFVRYGGLDGRVSLIAPDSSTNEDGTPYFRVVIETDKNYLGARDGELPITPGMEAIVDIRTGRKSVIDYLIKPVLKLKHEAFRER